MIQDQPTSSFGLAPNIAAGLASFFGVVGGLVILLGKPPQQWVRFIAVQSIVMCVVYIIVQIALAVINTMLVVVHLWALTPIVGLIGLLIGIAYFVAWLVQTIRAFQGAAQRFPFVSDLADKWVPASQQL